MTNVVYTVDRMQVEDPYSRKMKGDFYVAQNSIYFKTRQLFLDLSI